MYILLILYNSKLEKIVFYYFSEADKALPIIKPYKLINVADLWNSLDAKRKKYSCAYHIPNSKKVDEFIEAFNLMSFDPIPKQKIIDEVNSIPQFEAVRVWRLVREELESQKERGNPKSEDELSKNFMEISRIGLREGILPPALLMLYIINIKNPRV